MSCGDIIGDDFLAKLLVSGGIFLIFDDEDNLDDLLPCC